MIPWTAAHQAPQSMGFSRQEDWSGLPFPSPGDLPDPGIEPGSPALEADALTSEPAGKPYSFYTTSSKPQTQKKHNTLFISSHLCDRELIQEIEREGITLNNSMSEHRATAVIPQDPQLTLPIYKGAHLTCANHYLPPVGCVNHYSSYTHRSSVERDKENYSVMIITALMLEQNTRK